MDERGVRLVSDHIVFLVGMICWTGTMGVLVCGGGNESRLGIGLILRHETVALITRHE